MTRQVSAVHTKSGRSAVPLCPAVNELSSAFSSLPHRLTGFIYMLIRSAHCADRSCYKPRISAANKNRLDHISTMTYLAGSHLTHPASTIQIQRSRIHILMPPLCTTRQATYCSYWYANIIFSAHETSITLSVSAESALAELCTLCHN